MIRIIKKILMILLIWLSMIGFAAFMIDTAIDTNQKMAIFIIGGICLTIALLLTITAWEVF